MSTMRAIITALVITVSLLTGAVLIDGFVQARDASGGERIERDAAVFGDDYDGSYVAVNDIAGDNETVFKTTGYAVRLTGAPDSEVATTDGIDLQNDTSWHVSVWAEPDSSSTGDVMQVATLSDGEIVIYYNGTASEWAVWYYDQASLDTYEASVAASASPDAGLTNIQARANDSELRIYRNGTLGDTVDITTSSSTTAPTTDNWDGDIEELRTFDAALDSTNRSKLVNSPTQQRPDLPRTSRIQFDNPYDQDALVLFTGGEATVENGTLVKAGFAAQEMQGASVVNNITGSTDYLFDRDGPRIAVDSDELSNSELEGAPVAYVSYDSYGVGVSISSFASEWLSLAGILPLLLIAVVLIGTVQRLRG